MVKKARESLGITLPPKLIGKLDTLRNRNSKDKELAGRDRSACIEILIQKGLEAQDGKS